MLGKGEPGRVDWNRVSMWDCPTVKEKRTQQRRQNGTPSCVIMMGWLNHKPFFFLFFLINKMVVYN